jgi:hypothetical protein
VRQRMVQPTSSTPLPVSFFLRQLAQELDQNNFLHQKGGLPHNRAFTLYEFI